MNQISATSGLSVPVDIGERRKAINTNTSVLVKAPAGSGKTTLLTQRFLALLAIVEDPRHIVAMILSRLPHYGTPRPGVGIYSTSL